jgi:hypothetical protein
MTLPLTLAQANEYIATFHRHHKPAQGHRFSIGACDVTGLLGVAIVGRPVARGCDPYLTAEVTRLCTEGAKNVCSFLYAACARICKEMGFTKIQTYILTSEPGTTLKAAGWTHEADTVGGDWNHSAKYAGKRRTDQPQEPKRRYAKALT